MLDGGLKIENEQSYIIIISYEFSLNKNLLGEILQKLAEIYICKISIQHV